MTRTKARRLEVSLKSIGVNVKPDCCFRNPNDLDQWYSGLVMGETLNGECYIVRDVEGKDHVVVKEHVELIHEGQNAR